MIRQISWTEFWSFIIAALFIYYVFVAFRFYRPEIKKIVEGKFLQKKKSPDSP